MKHIIVVEDERSIADTVLHCIEREGFSAEWHTLGLAALERIREGNGDLIVLDVGLPDVSGFELCKAIRAFSAVPIIFLTARDEEIDTIVGLEIGADDYVTKPFSPRELGARIKTVLRRIPAASPPPTDEYAAMGAPAPGPGTPAPSSAFAVDSAKMTARYKGRALSLTRYEFGLLELLAGSPGRVFSRDALMSAVWGDDSPSLDRTVDAHIKSLRAKCRAIAPDTDPIRTLRGTGYALRDDL